jgi:hypothetical protein
LLKAIERLFPNIEFKGSKTHWIVKNLVGAIVVAFFFYLFSQLGNIVARAVIPLIK